MISAAIATGRSRNNPPLHSSNCPPGGRGWSATPQGAVRMPVHNAGGPARRRTAAASTRIWSVPPRAIPSSACPAVTSVAPATRYNIAGRSLRSARHRLLNPSMVTAQVVIAATYPNQAPVPGSGISSQPASATAAPLVSPSQPARSRASHPVPTWAVSATISRTAVATSPAAARRGRPSGAATGSATAVNAAAAIPPAAATHSTGSGQATPSRPNRPCRTRATVESRAGSATASPTATNSGQAPARPAARSTAAARVRVARRRAGGTRKRLATNTRGPCEVLAADWYGSNSWVVVGAGRRADPPAVILANEAGSNRLRPRPWQDGQVSITDKESALRFRPHRALAVAGITATVSPFTR